MSVTHCQGCGTELPPPTSKYAHRRKWCSNRCRKASYGDPCVDCGTRTQFGAESGRVPEPRCFFCAAEHKRRWTREAIIEAAQDFAAECGEPPASADWNAWHARHDLNDEARAQRYEAASGRWPSHNTVYGVFGSWGVMLTAAGFAPRKAHGGGGNVARRRRERAKVREHPTGIAA